MCQIKLILNRLKKPSILISIISEIATILLYFNISIDMNMVTGIITGIFLILIILGIISDPETQNKGYGDDLILCSGCNNKTRHVLVNGKMLCSQCGCENCMVLKKMSHLDSNGPYQAIYDIFDC